jgi:hypothetical protein
MLMLMHAEKMAMKEGPENIPIAWLPDGKSFVVVDKRKVAMELLPQFSFPRAKFESFVRKLYRWGFKQTISTNNQELSTLNPTHVEVIIFSNKNFHRDRKGLLWNMESAIAPCRRRAKEKRQQMVKSPKVLSPNPKTNAVASLVMGQQTSAQSECIVNGSPYAHGNWRTTYPLPSSLQLSLNDQNHRRLQWLHLQEQLCNLRNSLPLSSMVASAPPFRPIQVIEKTEYMSYSILLGGSNGVPESNKNF